MSGCGIKLEHDVKGKVDPVEVKHTLILDTNLLYLHYKQECATLFVLEADINNCADEKLNSFINSFTYSR